MIFGLDRIDVTMIALIKDAGGIPVLTTLPPLDAPRYFSWITRAA